MCCAVGTAEAGAPGSGHDAYLDALTGLRLHSPLAWPLSPAVAEDTLAAYNSVLAFLLQARTAHWAKHRGMGLMQLPGDCAGGG